MYYKMEYESVLGKIFIAAAEEGLVGLWLEGQKYFEDMGSVKATKKAREQGVVLLDKTEDFQSIRYFRENLRLAGQIF